MVKVKSFETEATDTLPENASNPMETDGERLLT